MGCEFASSASPLGPECGQLAVLVSQLRLQVLHGRLELLVRGQHALQSGPDLGLVALGIAQAPLEAGLLKTETVGRTESGRRLGEGKIADTKKFL